MFFRKFKKSFRSKQTRHKPQRSFQQSREHSSEERREATCYNCNNPRHIKAKYPKLLERYKKKMDKKKAMVATWSDSKEKTSYSEWEHTHMCFMANTHKDKVNSSDSKSNSLSYNEFEHGFRKLVKHMISYLTNMIKLGS